MTRQQASGGLATYLESKREAMTRAAANYSSGDQARETIAAESSSGDLTGLRRIQIRDFQVLSDSGTAFGGFGLGPSSPELLLGVLASCLNHTYLIGAAWMEIPLDQVSVRFEAENNDAGLLQLASADPPFPNNIRARVHLESEAPAADLARLHTFAAERCPLTMLVRQPLNVTISVE